MHRRHHVWIVGALVLIAFVMGDLPARAQYTGAPYYPYWSSAPSGYRGETWTDMALRRSSSLYPGPSYLTPGISLGSGVGSSVGASAFAGQLPFYYHQTPYALLPGAQLTLPRNTATIRLRLPEDAKVWFDGEKTSHKGTERVFHSPPLTPGKNYTYEVRAEWKKDGKPVEDKRTVRVHANADVQVDFTRPASK